MKNIPTNQVTTEDMSEWFRLQDELRRIKAKEMLLRTKIFAAYFPSPVEGTNSAPIGDGWFLKGKYSITREVDLAALGVLTEKLASAGVSKDKLVQYKPSLVLREYRTLTEDQQHLFDQCLVVKPGSPSLEIVLPAKSKDAPAQ